MEKSRFVSQPLGQLAELPAGTVIWARLQFPGSPHVRLFKLEDDDRWITPQMEDFETSDIAAYSVQFRPSEEGR